MSDILRLVTRVDREAAERAAYDDASHAEVLQMLQRAQGIAVENKAVSIAIAIAFEDGGYGTLIPLNGGQIGCLIGALVDCQHRLITSTEE